MKKIFSFLVLVNLAFGVNFNFADTNKTIDTLAYKGKIFTQIFDMFLSQNAPKINALEQNLTMAFHDINKTLSKFSTELVGIQNSILDSIIDANFSTSALKNDKLISILLDDNISNLPNTQIPKNNETKEIVNLDRDLINSVSVFNENGEFEVEIELDSSVSKDKFKELATKSADIVRKHNNSDKKVRVYVSHENSKFSGKF